MTCRQHQDMRARARSLRLAGWARVDICRELDMKDNATFAHWIKDLPIPPDVRTRGRQPAKRSHAESMRLEGRSYREIQEALGVPKSTLSGWLKDVPITDEHRAALAERKRHPGQRRADGRRARRIANTNSIMSACSEEIGTLSYRELLIAGVVAYWAEGAKKKPWNRHEEVVFMNSDPTLIELFLRWLEAMGVGGDRVRFRIHIHERADVDNATRFWIRRLGVDPSQFQKPVLKRHKPATIRRNVGEAYVGCLRVRVVRPTELYRKIAGWYSGIARAVDPATPLRGRPYVPRNSSTKPLKGDTLFESPIEYLHDLIRHSKMS